VNSRRAIVRDALGIGIATGAYALSFGALSVTAGLSILQTCALSLLMFTGASQFAFVGVIGAGGSPWAGDATAALLGSRNALYGLRLASLLEVKGLRRFGAAQLVIDESTAMAIARETKAESRLGFWSTGMAVFALWNLGTLIGALATHALPDPRVLGFDAAPPAAFLALLAPRLRAREPLAIACAAALVALVFLPFMPAGVPLLIVAVLVVLYGLVPRQ
jgi:predicted branched-subunit amino acid permease